jgi:hypothetical protein
MTRATIRSMALSVLIGAAAAQAAGTGMVFERRNVDQSEEDRDRP